MKYTSAYCLLPCRNMRIFLWLRYCLLVAWMGASPLATHAQLHLEIGAYSGKLYRHSERMTFGVPQPTRAASMEVLWQTDGRDYWHRPSGFPRIGATLVYEQYGNRDTLGCAYGFVPIGDFYLLRSKRAALFCRWGMGLAYLNKPYNRLRNAGNPAIGSHLNNLTILGILAEWQLTPKIAINAGAMLMHSSNARYQSPNLGLNTGFWRGGINYSFAPKREYKDFPHELFPCYRKLVFGMRMGMAFTESKVIGGAKYPIRVFSPYVSLLISPTHKMLLGYQWVYDGETAARIRDFGEGVAQRKRDIWRTSFAVGHEFMFGRLGFLTQAFFYTDGVYQGNSWGAKLGPNVYLYRPYKRKRTNAFVGAYLTAHGTVAQYVEITMGASF